MEKNLGKIERLETTLDKIRKQKDYFEAWAKKLGQEVEEYQAKQAKDELEQPIRSRSTLRKKKK